jgi:single-stranded-DNA-specific exonuclease
MRFLTRKADPLLYQRHLTLTGQKFLSALAAKRGIVNLEDFLSSHTKDLVDPFIFTQMKKAITLINDHITSSPESFVLHCDYDCDGIMSSYIFTHFVRLHWGVTIKAVVNDREKEGYGLTVEVVQKLYDQGYRFILTADNGISSSDAALHAKNLGITLVITDHHEPKIDLDGHDILPLCDALVCHKATNNTTTKVDLCGAATIWTLCRAINEDIAASFVDAAGLATVVDMVSLADPTNRIMVKNALHRINHSLFSTPTLHNFFSAIGTKYPLNESDFGFGIGPVINAVGRIAKAQDLVDLLSDENKEIESFSPFVILNEERKELTTQFTKIAIKKVLEESDLSFHLLVIEDCPEGILGLIASRIENMTTKPTIVLTPKDDELKGSGRSRTLDLQTLFDPKNDLPLKGGGHKEACGVSFKAKDLQVIKDFLSSLDIPSAQHTIDGLIDVAMISPDFINQIDALSPFGTGFERPSFLFTPSTIEEVRLMKEVHLAFKSEKTKFICFNFAEKISSLENISNYHISGKLELNEYRGVVTPQVMIERFFDKSVVTIE